MTLNGVKSGNLLTLQSTVFTQTASTALPVPTDTQGTWSTARSVAGASGVGPGWCKSSIFYQANVGSGTHTVTPDADGISRHHTLCEWEDMKASSVLDASNGNTISNTDHTSNQTGTTGTLNSLNELILISLGLAATSGVSDVGFTNPVSTYSNLQIIPNDQTDVATYHSYKIVKSTTAENPTFNWTQHEAQMASQSAIASFFGAVTSIAWTTA
jgi:hypothetical protein